MRAFVDTNLWVYRFDRREPDRRAFVRDWLRRLAQEHEIVISTQVLVEFRAAATRKLLPALTGIQLRESLTALAQFDVFPADTSLVLDANEMAVAHQISWFDALIIEAAIRAGCETLYSEDLQDRRRFGSLTVVNPLD